MPFWSREERLRRRAADWVVRSQDGLTSSEQRALEQWCAAHPDHRAAFERVRRNFQGSAVLRHSEIAEHRTLARTPPRPRRQAGFALASLAAALAGAAVISTSWTRQPAMAALVLESRPGEVRRLRLGDGSHLALDTASAVRVSLSSKMRSAEVERGRARLTIAEDERPFRVAAAGVTVTMNRGTVEAAAAAGGGGVTVIEGEARAEAEDRQAGAATVLPGQRASVGPGGEVSLSPSPAPGRWPQGLLEFKGAPLAAAAAEANRYAAAGNRIEVDPSAAGLKVTGVFRAGDTAALARSLAAALGLEVRSGPAGTLLLARAQKKNGG